MGKDGQQTSWLCAIPFLQHVTHRSWSGTDQEHQRLVVSSLTPRACALKELSLQTQPPTSKRTIARSGHHVWLGTKKALLRMLPGPGLEKSQSVHHGAIQGVWGDLGTYRFKRTCKGQMTSQSQSYLPLIEIRGWRTLLV